MKKYISYLGLLAILVYAYLLDYGIALLKEFGMRSFVLAPYLWGALLANLFLAISVLGLFWLILVRRRLGKIPALVFVVVGLLITFYPALAIYIPGLFPMIENGLIEFDSRLMITSAFVVVMGLWGLLVPANLARSRDFGAELPADGNRIKQEG